MKKTILSAIQPTGDMHYGNYFGAIKNWVDLQSDYKCIYGVVDYHAMTMPYKLDKLRNNTWDIIYNLLAVGVDVNNLFIQSLIPEHTELNWIFNCFASYGQLTRMTQFKDKGAQAKDVSKDNFISVALLDYPVLQSADILIYKADYVPVGKDQEQHLELTRSIAQRFNFSVDKEYFVMPEGLYTETPKIKSTADPDRKMSKSAGEKHYISVFADEARIRKQIKSAVTDTGEPSHVMSEGVKNLFQMLSATGNKEASDALMLDYNAGALRYGDLKAATADSLVEMSKNFVERKSEIISNKKEVKYQIKASSAEIRKIAQETIKEVKDMVGIMNVKF